MDLKRVLWLGGIAAVIAIGGAWIFAQFQQPLLQMVQAGQGAQPVSYGAPPAGGQDRFDVPYVPTHERVVEEMLKMARVTKDDVVYDLGCGDGRIVITAAKKYGARGVGVDIDPERIKESKENARKAGVTDRVTFVQRDLFKMDLKEASVVTLYLLPEINLKLRPKLFKELKPGTRIVSHDFDMGEWKPERTVNLRVDRNHVLYYWTIPAKADQAAALQSEAGDEKRE
jgi:SAM-dependent methyltransferase